MKRSTRSVSCPLCPRLPNGRRNRPGRDSNPPSGAVRVRRGPDRRRPRTAALPVHRAELSHGLGQVSQLVRRARTRTHAGAPAHRRRLSHRTRRVARRHGRTAVRDEHPHPMGGVDNYWHRACAPPPPDRPRSSRTPWPACVAPMPQPGNVRPNASHRGWGRDRLHPRHDAQNADTWQDRLRERRDSAAHPDRVPGSLPTRGVVRPATARHHPAPPGRAAHLGSAIKERPGRRRHGQGHPVRDRHRACPPCVYRRWLDVVLAHHQGGRDAVAEFLGAPDHSARTSATSPTLTCAPKL